MTETTQEEPWDLDKLRFWLGAIYAFPGNPKHTQIVIQAVKAINRLAHMEGALRGLLSRDDFWSAVEQAGIDMPAEFDDCMDALAQQNDAESRHGSTD